jgi:hypothetical protein
VIAAPSADEPADADLRGADDEGDGGEREGKDCECDRERVSFK